MPVNPRIMEIGSHYPTYNYTSILESLEKGDLDKAMELFWEDLEDDWITYVQIMCKVDNIDPRLGKIFDLAMEYFLEKEEYRKCKRIKQAREFLEFRRSDQ